MTQDSDADAPFRWVRPRTRPAGERQHLTYLLVVVAIRRALAARASHRRAMASASAEVRAELQRDAEGRIDTAHLDGSGEERADLLRHTILWSETSQLAANCAATLVAGYRDDHGLLIDIDTGAVHFDDSFDALAQQQRRRTAAQRRATLQARAIARVIVNVSGDHDLDSLRSAIRIPDSPQTRLAVETRLRALGVGDLACETALFVLAYLSDNTASLNYLEHNPVMVDPGEVVKPAVARDLSFAARGLPWPSEEAARRWSRNTTVVLGRPDRGLALRAVDSGPNPAMASLLWPAHTDRGAATQLLWRYRARVQSAIGTAEQLAVATDPRDINWGVIDHAVTAMQRDREILDRLTDSHSLVGIEKTRLGTILTRFDLGDTTLDRLIFVGEIAMRDADLDRLRDEGDRIARSASAEITAAVTDAGLVYERAAPERTLRRELGALAPESIFTQLAALAHGDGSGHAPTDLIASSERHLSDQHVDHAAAVSLRGLVESWRASAAESGRQVQACRAQWDHRITEVCLARDQGTLAFPALLIGSRLARPGQIELPADTSAHITDALPGQIDRTVDQQPTIAPTAGAEEASLPESMPWADDPQ